MLGRANGISHSPSLPASTDPKTGHFEVIIHQDEKASLHKESVFCPAFKGLCCSSLSCLLPECWPLRAGPILAQTRLP